MVDHTVLLKHLEFGENTDAPLYYVSCIYDKSLLDSFMHIQFDKVLPILQLPA